jgi:hypothetical protein
MATFNRVNSLVEALAEKVHNFSTDTLKVALTNSAPSASNTQLSDITQISYTNLSSRTITTTSSSQTGGVYKLVLADLALTASGGSVAAFRYIVIYNDTATNDELIGWYDKGASVTLLDGDQLNIDFDGTNGVLQIALV